MKYTIRQLNFPTDGSLSSQKITLHQFNSDRKAIEHAQKLKAREYNKFNTVELLDDDMNEIQLPNSGMRTLFMFMLIVISAVSVIGLIAWIVL